LTHPKIEPTVNCTQNETQGKSTNRYTADAILNGWCSGAFLFQQKYNYGYLVIDS
jgi:hypothetical protein